MSAPSSLPVAIAKAAGETGCGCAPPVALPVVAAKQSRSGSARPSDQTNDRTVTA